MKNLKKFNENWSADVETKWSPKEGIFTKSAEKIASYLKKESDSLKQAMSRLNFYINRGGKKLSSDDKTRLENAKDKLHKLYENYPPGAEHDSRAPWNQRDPHMSDESFEDVIENEDGDKIPVKISYQYYYESENDLRKQISSYDFDITGDRTKLKEEYIDEDVRNLIVNHIGDRYYDWQC